MFNNKNCITERVEGDVNRVMTASGWDDFKRECSAFRGMGEKACFTGKHDKDFEDERHDGCCLGCEIDCGLCQLF